MKGDVHPIHQIIFDIWLEKIDDKVSSGEFGLCVMNKSVWSCNVCHMSILEDQHAVVSVIDSFYKRVQQQKGSKFGQKWLVPYAALLMKYAPLYNVGKHQCCYHTTKQDPRIVLVFDDRNDTNQCCNDSSATWCLAQQTQQQEQERQSQLDMILFWRPLAFAKIYKEPQNNDKESQLMLFHHITKFVATQES